MFGTNHHPFPPHTPQPVFCKDAQGLLLFSSTVKKKKNSTFNCSRPFINLYFQSQGCSKTNFGGHCLFLGGFNLSYITLLQTNIWKERHTSLGRPWRGQELNIPPMACAAAPHAALFPSVPATLPAPGLKCRAQVPVTHPHHHWALGDTAAGSGNSL